MPVDSRSRRPLILAWLFFVISGVFLSLMIPLGEGMDEVFHLDYIQHVSQEKSVPLGSATKISHETDLFLENYPAPWTLHQIYTFPISYEQFWSDKDLRDNRIPNIDKLRYSGRFTEGSSPISTQYESHQPPFYYILAGPVFAVAASHASLLNVFLMLRLFTVLVGSLIVPGTYFLAESILENRSAALAATRLVVLFPGIYPGIVRVSNDALCAAIACWTFYFLSRYLKSNESRFLYALSASLVMGLWTKAFFVPIAGAVIIAMLWRRRFRDCAILTAICVLGLPWYLRTFLLTGSATGLPETVLAKTSLSSSLSALLRVNWKNVWDVAISSHIWAGYWSFLGVRSWMIKLIFWSFCLGMVGLVLTIRKSSVVIPVLVFIYVVFASSLVYYASQVFQQTGVSIAQGWYLTSMLPIEATLFVAGIRRLWGSRWWVHAALMQLFLLAFLGYCNSLVALPYYAGITSHHLNSSVSTYHPKSGDPDLITSRLLLFHSGIPMNTPWMLFAAAGMIGCYCVASTVRDLKSREKSLEIHS